MARPSQITPAALETILDMCAGGATGSAIAAVIGVPAHRVNNVVVGARKAGDPRAHRRNAGAGWRLPPARYASSRAYLDEALARAREAQARWEVSEMGRRMREIAEPPLNAS